MPARASICQSSRSLLFHVKRDSSCKTWSQGLALRAQHRAYSDKPIADRPFENQSNHGEPKGPNMDSLPHVSEEAAATKKSMGEQGPEIEQQGSPVSEVVKDDKEAQENLPKVMKEQIQRQQASTSGSGGAQGKKSFSTLARQDHKRVTPSLSTHMGPQPSKRRALSTSTRKLVELQHEPNDEPNMPALQHLITEGLLQDQPHHDASRLSPGLKFDLPTTKPGKALHLKKRYEPIVEQVTKLLMKDGKLSAAQRHMNIILTHLRTSPAPRPSDRTLAPDAPPLTELPLDPVMYLTVALDSISPLFRLRSVPGLAGGGLSIPVPKPLHQRQRRRTAVMWILDQVEKRKGSVSPFPKRFAEEVVSIVEGRSSLWDRRQQLHSQGTRARANINARPIKKGRR